MRTTLLAVAFAALLTVTIIAGSVRASSHDDVAALRKQVAELQAEVKQLEVLKPTFTGFMPNFSERFHVMHIAGDAGDWQVANHEFLELERLMKASTAVDEQKGKQMQTFLQGGFHEIQEAIEHGDQQKFDTAMRQTVQNCNACHTAVGSPFIKVSLDVPPNLSMRHPHIFAPTKVDEMHHHTH